MSKYIVVHFHADGGQACTDGLRTFTNEKDANKFADLMRSEPNHSCGPNSIKIEYTDKDKGNIGAIYPTLANS